MQHRFIYTGSLQFQPWYIYIYNFPCFFFHRSIGRGWNEKLALEYEIPWRRSIRFTSPGHALDKGLFFRHTTHRERGKKKWIAFHHALRGTVEEDMKCVKAYIRISWVCDIYSPDNMWFITKRCLTITVSFVHIVTLLSPAVFFIALLLESSWSPGTPLLGHLRRFSWKRRVQMENTIKRNFTDFWRHGFQPVRRRQNLSRLVTRCWTLCMAGVWVRKNFFLSTF